jgi:cellulase
MISYNRTIQRRWDSFNPIQDATDATLSCNNDGSALPSGQQKTATISAGSAITAYWNKWEHDKGPQ